MKALKILLTLRAWKKSKTLNLAALLLLLPPIDVTFFSGEVGHQIVAGLMKLLALLPWAAPTEAGAVAFLVWLIGGVVAWLRTRTILPLEHK